ncbi:cupin domain-containing protein [uncultured Flavonifractor sp.]|uniref:cupin domain-containing protein n=1 Tax=uncultured Flavonifractor sp. TaxID=1193534 RepID=UPI002633B0B5|nr:cupin domain-containing protein [uncultured Flavonifractor sp.]
MPTPLTDKQAQVLGVATRHERMDNGELRFRLCASDGSSYIRTQAGAQSGWQNSHLHRYVHELNVIQQGVMLVVEERDGLLVHRVLRAGDFYLCPLNVPHNSYMLPGTVAHTVKYGQDLPDVDWVVCPWLDPRCRALDVDALVRASSPLPAREPDL